MLLQTHCIQLDRSLWILYAFLSISAVNCNESGPETFAESGLLILQEQTLSELPLSKVP